MNLTFLSARPSFLPFSEALLVLQGSSQVLPPLRSLLGSSPVPRPLIAHRLTMFRTYCLLFSKPITKRSPTSVLLPRPPPLPGTPSLPSWSDQLLLMFRTPFDHHTILSSSLSPSQTWLLTLENVCSLLCLYQQTRRSLRAGAMCCSFDPFRILITTAEWVCDYVDS